ncbi:uncharacterized protein [Watersipora subatra]|uniref:uncharacterized protein n=1 Tax=Watersipora subatra TaxID=2589382 RepID=UPI00355C920C
METISFDYSTKNINIPSQKDYMRSLIAATESLCRRIRWQAFFFLHPEITTANKETYGFNSKKSPPSILELQSFETQLFNLIRNVKFRHKHCEFQNTLRKDIQQKIQSTNKLIISADKTSHYYQLDTDKYIDMLRSSITQCYKKVDNTETDNINSEAKSIAKALELDDRINITAKREAYVTLKDHKANFVNHPTCRLINPTRSEIGKISKIILERINEKVVNTLKLNQWRNTSAVLKWFTGTDNKSQSAFITFDVVEFYPSIKSNLLLKSLDFASEYATITDEERHIIMHSKKSILHHSGEDWGKSSADNLFDVTMGSHDGAETCELVGCFLLHLIKQKYGDKFGLYRDDGLGIIQDSPRNIENIKKDLCSIFKQQGLKITTEANSKVVNFLDVTLNLTNGEYRPYIKPSDKPIYVHARSNHPPCILKNIPRAINQRLSTLSSSKDCFQRIAPTYQQALQQSGYDYKLSYLPKSDQTNKQKRKRNIIWYNPPYSMNVASNIGKQFLNILRTEFPPGHKLHKVFNANTIKLSYRCMSNIKSHINAHNKALLLPTRGDNSRTCNCRNRASCPMDGKCLTENAVYQATVTTNNGTEETYVGLTQNTFKTRYTNHKASFNHTSKRNATELSKYIWRLKDSGLDYNIKWSILKTARPYSPITKRCELCIWEKYYIICKPQLATLNKRNEILSSCRHANKFLLRNSVT